VLAICCLSLLLVGMDVTIVNVALPRIQHDLKASISQLQWILDAYTLVVASFLMLAGATSDRFGRRRVFQIGITVFTLGSLLCSLAPDIGALIGFRALQGLGASMLNPVALSIIASVIPSPRDRARAIGIWGAVAGVSLAIGPLLGGILTQTVGWRAIFWINIPIGVAAFALAARFIPESKAARPRAFDPAGQALVFLGLASVTCGVIEGPRAGWGSPLIVGLFLFSAISWVGFVRHEAGHPQPLLDLRFFRSLPFSTAAVLALCAFGSFSAFLFLNALYLEQVRGLSAFQTGLCTLPLAVAMMICAPMSGHMVAAAGSRPPVLLAGLGFCISTGILTQLTGLTPVPLLILSYAIFGAALGMVNPAISNTAVAGMPLAQAGVAAAVASTGRQVGAALGVAIAGTVVGSRHADGVSFSRSTHPIWWLTAACGVVTLFLGWASTGRRAEISTARVAHLLGE
jgi:EmrB/QacA subfamily drug resistance transporter